MKFDFQLVIVFGTSQITAVQKQLTAYQGYYFEKAKSDGEMIGKPLTLRNFTDSIMETKHRVKKGNFLFSGGKSGPIGKAECWKQVLQQQFLSKYLRIETSSSYQTNVSRKLEYDPAEKHSVSNFPRELVLSLTVVSNTEKKNQPVVHFRVSPEIIKYCQSQ